MKAKSGRKPRKGSPTPLLNKLYRNDIFEAIQAAGLEPREFDLKDSGVEARVKHKRSASYFVVGGGASTYVGRYVVGDMLEWPYEVYRLDAVVERVGQWLRYLKLDLDTPDLWAELQSEAKLLEAGSNAIADNTPFTADEQKEIERRLDKLAKDVSNTHSFSAAQLKALNEKFDYLVKASGRLGRKDWLNAFIGVTLAFMLSVALAPESARRIFLTFLRAIGLLYPELHLDYEE